VDGASRPGAASWGSAAEKLQRNLTPIGRRVVEAAVTVQESPTAIDFLHTVLCQAGLPHQNPGEAREWERRQGDALLRIEAGSIMDHPRKSAFRPIGLPFGERARLVLIHLTGEALRSGSPVVELEDSLTAYVRELGIATTGRTIRTVKDQLGRLSAATVRLAFRVGDGRAVQVNSTLIGGLDLWATQDARQRVLWPSTVRLSADFFASIQRHAVPLARSAIRALAHSSVALDAYCWLAQRLHRVPAGKPQPVSWVAVKEQFGAGYARERDFRRVFRDVLRAVLIVYPEARVEEVEGGLLLYRSRPPIAPRIVALGRPG
jgi:hypothetical protein